MKSFKIKLRTILDFLNNRIEKFYFSQTLIKFQLLNNLFNKMNSYFIEIKISYSLNYEE